MRYRRTEPMFSATDFHYAWTAISDGWSSVIDMHVVDTADSTPGGGPPWIASMRRDDHGIDVELFFARTVDDVSRPAHFFANAAASGESYTLAVFASIDESLLGRTCGVSRLRDGTRTQRTNGRSDRICGVTVIDDRLTMDALAVVLFEMMERVAQHKGTTQTLEMLDVLKYERSINGRRLLDETVPVVRRAIIENARLTRRYLAWDLVTYLHADLRSIVKQHASIWPRAGAVIAGAGMSDVSARRGVDMLAAFRDAPPPLAAVPGSDSSAITVRGGRTALSLVTRSATFPLVRALMARPDDSDAQLMAVRSACAAAHLTETTAGQATTWILIAPEFRQIVYADVASMHLDGRTVVAVTGVPVHQVATAFELFDHGEDKDVLSSGLSARDLQAVEGMRARRGWATNVILRAVDRNLAGIKAKLWRPGGPLHASEMRRLGVACIEHKASAVNGDP